MEDRRVANDLIDIVEELTNMAAEMNPGATEQIRRLRFLIGRAERLLNQPDFEAP